MNGFQTAHINCSLPSRASVCEKVQDLVDTFRRKIDKSGDAGTPLNDRCLQWKFWDRMSFLKEYIVNRN